MKNIDLKFLNQNHSNTLINIIYCNVGQLNCYLFKRVINFLCYIPAEAGKTVTPSRNHGLHLRGQTLAPFISFSGVMIRSSIVDLGIKGDVTRPLLGLCKGIISGVGTPDLSFVLEYLSRPLRSHGHRTKLKPIHWQRHIPTQYS